MRLKRRVFNCARVVWTPSQRIYLLTKLSCSSRHTICVRYPRFAVFCLCLPSPALPKITCELSANFDLRICFCVYSTPKLLDPSPPSVHPPSSPSACARCSCLRRPSLKLTILSKAKRDPTIWRVVRLGKLAKNHSCCTVCPPQPSQQQKHFETVIDQSDQHQTIPQIQKPKNLPAPSLCSCVMPVMWSMI